MSALPSAPPAGVASPGQMHMQMPSMASDVAPQHQYADHSQPVQQQKPQQQHYQQQQHQQQHQQHTQQQEQQQQQNVYYPQSFPQAPAAVFPDAPSDEISNDTTAKSVEKEEQKEALLIEL
jgi:hypothetical protein